MTATLPRRCARCRYDLRGADPGPARDRCPECGQVLTAAALAAAREKRFLWRLASVLVVLGGAGVAVAVLAAALLPARAWVLVPLFGVIVAMGAVPVLVAAAGERAMSDGS